MKTAPGGAGAEKNSG